MWNKRIRKEEENLEDKYRRKDNHNLDNKYPKKPGNIVGLIYIINPK